MAQSPDGESLAVKKTGTTAHLSYIDGLRAIAVLGVVFSHAAKYTMDMHQGVIFHVLYEGSHGVDLFFVISGFCLAYPSLSRRFSTGSARFDVVEFFSRRIVRIMPPYWVAFAAILAVALLAVRAGEGLPWPAVQLPSFAMGVRQLFFVDDGRSLVCGSFWTLAVEFRWYLMFPLILWLYFRAPAVLAAACVLAVVIYDFTPVRPWDLATLPAFVMGILAADLSIRRAAVCRYALPLFAAAVVASVALEPKGHLDYALQNQLWWQVAGFLLVVAGGQGILRRALENRAAVFVGAASYSIYLVHDPGMAWYGYSGGANPLLAVVVGVLSGIAFWYFVERNVASGQGRDLLLAATRGLLRPMTGSVRTTVELTSG